MSNEINEKNKINEEELEQVAGGFLNKDCWFVHKTGKVRKRWGGIFDGGHEAECGADCRGVTNYRCRCHGGEICVNRWHIVTENGSPLPKNEHENWYS